MEGWSWKQQLELAGWEALAQITGWKYFYHKAGGLTKLKIHIETERAKQLLPHKGERSFNRYIKKRDNYTCYLCGHYRCYQDNKPMTTEHKHPLSRHGYTTEANCSTACWHCNSDKGTMTVQEYQASQKPRKQNWLGM
jgi:HNH endonuclease